MTQAQAEQAKAQATKFASMGQMAGVFISPISQAAITPFWGGFIPWLGGSLVLRQRFAYLKAVGVVGLTLGVLAIGAIVRGLFCRATGGAVRQRRAGDARQRFQSQQPPPP